MHIFFDCSCYFNAYFFMKLSSCKINELVLYLWGFTWIKILENNCLLFHICTILCIFRLNRRLGGQQVLPKYNYCPDCLMYLQIKYLNKCKDFEYMIINNKIAYLKYIIIMWITAYKTRVISFGPKYFIKIYKMKYLTIHSLE